MSDLTREEAIQVLQTALTSPFIYGEYADAIDKAIEALSQPNYETDTEVRLAVTNRKKEKVILWDSFGSMEYVPSAEAEWIPCSERLPEYRETVIISTFWGVKTGYLDSTEAYGDFWEIIEEDGTAGLHSIYAWQPLPKPYKGGDTE